MEGFTLECRDCSTKSEYKNEEDRLTEDIKILNHRDGIRIVCTKCKQQQELK